MKHNTFEIYTDGLRFVYENNYVHIYNTESTHNLIQSYRHEGIDTRVDLEVEACFWLKENNVLNV